MMIVGCSQQTALYHFLYPYCISSGILDIRQRNLGAFGSGVRNVGKSFPAAAIERASERSVGGRFGD